MTFFSNYFFENNRLYRLFICLLFGRVITEITIFQKYYHHYYPKAMSLPNGYTILMSWLGIYSFYPNITIQETYYLFTSTLIPINSNEEGQNIIEHACISQFSGEDDENEVRYLLILINKILFVFSEKGYYLFYKDISSELSSNNILSLVAYKFSNNNYFFAIGYTDISTLNYLFSYYKIYFDSNNVSQISLINQKDGRLYFNNQYYYILSEKNSCNKMISSSFGVVLTCFYSLIHMQNSMAAFSFNPDNDFEILFMSNIYDEGDNKLIQYISSVTNNDGSKAFICYIIETNIGKCVSYDINNNTISDVIIKSNYCSCNLFGLHAYYFEKINEFVFSCIDGDELFFMKRLDVNFNIIDDNDIYNGIKILNCTSFSTFSVLYDEQSNSYLLYIQMQCDTDTYSYIKVLNLGNISKSSEQSDQNSITDKLSEIETTNSKIESSELFIDSTIITTQPLTTIQNIITEVLTTIPIVSTTQQEISLPKIASTETEILTQFQSIITTEIENKELPKNISTEMFIKTQEYEIITNLTEQSESSIPNLISTEISIPSQDQTIFTSPITYSTKIISTEIEINKDIELSSIQSQIVIETYIESFCLEIGKIFYKGNCICDIDKGYYSLNYKSSIDKCYKKSEIPKNFYFNNSSKSYELCFKTCETCVNGGTSLSHNCLTCSSNYIMEQENNSSNCVDKCKYYFYYDSFNQYTCTEDFQCPKDASLLIRNKNKCINKCVNDDKYLYQYNSECLSICPSGTKPNENNICQISNTTICSLTDYKLDLNEDIEQENIKIFVKNYANEFYYTSNHISKFDNLNFTMLLYKNNSCIDKLNLNVTKIDYDSCIKQLKQDNDINENQDLIVVLIDVVNGDNPITSFGFFHPKTGEKLDASKSCSDKNLTMYENILSILNEPLALQLLYEQKINVFDLNDDFYTDICFKFDSPNGKDSTLQDRIKTFYPKVVLCDKGCRKKGINMTSMEAICECKFHDLLSMDILNNDLIGDNILVKEALDEFSNMLSNVNIEVLKCYKDVFTFKYFKKNIGGHIILALIIFETICVLYYWFKSYQKLIRFIYSLTEKFIIAQRQNNNSNNNDIDNTNKVLYKNSIKKRSIDNIINNPPRKSIKNKNNSLKNITKYKSSCNLNKIKKTSIKTEANKIIISKEPSLIFNKSNNKLLKKSNNKSCKNLIISKNKNIVENDKYDENIKDKRISIYKIKNISNNFFKIDIYDKINLDEILKPTFENMDYDDALEDDKRTFFQYFFEKIKINQKIINCFFILEFTKPRPIKILIFLLNLNLYFLINGLFYSESYISEVFNSKKQEKMFSFISRSIYRFTYCTVVGHIIGSIMQILTVDEIKIVNTLKKKGKSPLELRFEISSIIKSIIIKNRILIITNYIIAIFSWYYISCFNNVYPNIKIEWIISSIFIIIIAQILIFIIVFLETCIRFISFKCKSEKLYKLSHLLSY